MPNTTPKRKRPSDLPKNNKEYVLNEIENTIRLVEGHGRPGAVFVEGSNAMLDALKSMIAPLKPSDPMVKKLGSAIKKAVNDTIDGYDCVVVNPYHGSECGCDECSAAMEEYAAAESDW